MSAKVMLKAQIRDVKGKGAARRARRAGAVPAVVYAGGKQATSISVQPLELVRALTTPARRNALIELDIAGQGTKNVMLKDLQKDPIKREATHADFVEVALDKPVDVMVPFVTTGRSAAVVAGGKLMLPLRELRVRCLPTAIPDTIEYDTTSLDWGAHRASDVTMPEGVELLIDPSLTVLTISRPRGTTEEEETTAAPAAAAAAPEAPAAG
jgi:large subunit ribosomal protein L25